jgi:hypothetical protein
VCEKLVAFPSHWIGKFVQLSGSSCP